MMAGMHLTLNLDKKYSAQQVCKDALQFGVRLHCGTEFADSPNIPNQLMLGLGRIAQHKIEPAIEKLTKCIK